MSTVKRFSFLWVASTLIGGLALVGCGKSETETAAATPPATKPAAVPLIEVAAIDWCKEHLMPESICVQCHAELADAFKKNGDWCAEHGLPNSQCFKHHPELKEKFAAEFKTKFGKEPPI